MSIFQKVTCGPVQDIFLLVSDSRRANLRLRDPFRAPFRARFACARNGARTGPISDLGLSSPL